MRELVSTSPPPAPVVPSFPDAVAETPEETGGLISLLCTSLVVMTVVTSRLALPLGAKQVPLTLPVAVAHLVAIALLARGRLSGPRTLAIGFALAVVLFETGLIHRHTSLLSLWYVLAIYVPLVVDTGLDPVALRRIWRIFIRLAGIAAVLGIVQIAGQVAAGGTYFDPVQSLPPRLQLQGYQTTYPIMTGVLPTLKANGMLFVEASAFSQFLALAFLGELWLFRRWSVLVLLASGLVVSFSGTGLLMIAGGLLLGGRVRTMIAVGAIGGIAASVLAVTGYSEAFASRLDEIRRPGTSGYERFVAPFAAMALPWEDSPEAVFWGYGAGQVEELDTEFAANYSPGPKVFLEYGLVGLLAFGVVWLTMFAGLAVPRSVIGSMLVMYFLAAGSFLQPYTVFALWGLTAGFLRRAPETPAADEPAGFAESGETFARG